jgi:hypothetical protein
MFYTFASNGLECRQRMILGKMDITFVFTDIKTPVMHTYISII